MITAYAVAAGLRAAPTASGIGGAPVQVVRHRSLAVAVTRHGSPTPRSREAVLAHAGVCEDVMAQAEAVLPVRFGESFDDEPALRASLDARHDLLVRGLEHVRGRVEVGVRVRWEPGEPPAPPPPGDGAGEGRAYLMARVAEERRRTAVEREADAVATVIHAAVGEWAADSRLEVLPTDRLLMSAVYLVERHDVDRMVARVRAIARERPHLDVLCTGPWPPYSFADGEETRAH